MFHAEHTPRDHFAQHDECMNCVSKRARLAALSVVHWSRRLNPRAKSQSNKSRQSKKGTTIALKTRHECDDDNETISPMAAVFIIIKKKAVVFIIINYSGKRERERERERESRRLYY